MLGQRIRKLRVQRGVSLEELSDRLDIPVDCLVDVEEGKRKLSQSTIKEVADIFHVTEAELTEEHQPAKEAEPEITQESIGKRIRELREQKGMTLGEMARRADMSAAHLSEVERGLSAASLKTLDKVAEVLQISTAVLLGSVDCDPLGERLRRLRERVGLTQKELAEHVGVSHALVGQVETGRLQPSVATLTRLASALGVSPCYFLIEQEVTSRRNAAADVVVPETVNYPEVRAFLAMLGAANDVERQKLLGLLSWLTDWRGTCGAPAKPDPFAEELLNLSAGLSPADKSFLLENARYISRKGK